MTRGLVAIPPRGRGFSRHRGSFDPMRFRKQRRNGTASRRVVSLQLLFLSGTG
jgi:hypothetical protein